MTSPGAPYGVVGVPVQVGVLVNWTNLSIFPPFDGLLLRRVGVVLVAGEGL